MHKVSLRGIPEALFKELCKIYGGDKKTEKKRAVYHSGGGKMTVRKLAVFPYDPHGHIAIMFTQLDYGANEVALLEMKTGDEFEMRDLADSSESAQRLLRITAHPSSVNYHPHLSLHTGTISLTASMPFLWPLVRNTIERAHELSRPFRTKPKRPK